MTELQNTDELEALLGTNIQNLRLQKNIAQPKLAEMAGVSRGALQSLEAGRGSTITTMLKVVRALGRADWVNSLAPTVAVNPLDVVKKKPGRRRASSGKAEHG